MLCLDEAYGLPSKGFQEQNYDVFQYTPKTCAVGLFSAPMPGEVLDLAEKFMKDLVRILVSKEELTLEGIKQFYIAISREERKLDTLCDLYETVTITHAIIYKNARRKCESIAESLS